jgi:hypothetical protein
MPGDGQCASGKDMEVMTAHPGHAQPEIASPGFAIFARRFEADGDQPRRRCLDHGERFRSMSMIGLAMLLGRCRAADMVQRQGIGASAAMTRAAASA